jgi:myo-inositol-1(or 4)-monophosphatase
MTTDMSGLGELALRLARTGATAIDEVLAGGLRIGSKSSRNDLVTNADRAAEKAIVAALRDARPDDAILGEELGEHPGTSGLRWLVDPVDGTTNFVHGRRDFAVSVGVERAGEPVAGAILRPAYGDWVLADGGRADGSAGTPQLAPTATLTEALVSVGFPHRPELRARVYSLLGWLGPQVRDFRRIGSACCDLFSVATGTLDAYVGVEQAPWDVAAGNAIVRAVGGRCTTVWTAGDLRVFLAGVPAVVEPLAQLLSRAGDEGT